jgi:hypothetical protein
VIAGRFERWVPATELAIRCIASAIISFIRFAVLARFGELGLRLRNLLKPIRLRQEPLQPCNRPHACLRPALIHTACTIAITRQLASDLGNATGAGIGKFIPALGGKAFDCTSMAEKAISQG